MNFKKKYTKMTIVLAMVQGVLLGIAAVAIVGFILLKTDKPDSSAAPNAEVPATGPATSDSGQVKKEDKIGTPAAGAPIAMYAKQHGVFSSSESAASFISESALPKAAVVHSENQYYVWSALGVTENEADPGGVEGVFRKAVNVSPLACDSGEGELLRTVLSAQQVSEIQDLVTSQKERSSDDQKKEFLKKITAITAFTDDLNVIRLHILAHYSETGACVKLDF